MKHFTVFIFLLICFSSCNVEERPNDWKEYGYIENVKKLKSTRYSDLQKEGENWILREDKILFKQEKYFNKDGNAFQVKYFYPINNNLWEEQTINVKFRNGLKHSYVMVDNKGNFIESAKYTWLDNMNYKVIAERKNGSKLTSYSKLNDDYRDLSGGFQYFLNDSLIESETYLNNFKLNGRYLGSDYVDEIKNIKYTLVQNIIEKDSVGNATFFTIENKESAKIKYIETREFEYYE